MSETQTNNNIHLIITKTDLDENNYYIGKVDVSDYTDKVKSITIDANLGPVRFASNLCSKGSIEAGIGSSIWVDGAITTGGYISIRRGFIYTSKSISAEGFIYASESISGGGSIEAGTFVSGGGRVSLRK